MRGQPVTLNTQHDYDISGGLSDGDVPTWDATAKKYKPGSGGFPIWEYDEFTVAATPSTTYWLSYLPYGINHVSRNGVTQRLGTDYTVDNTTGVITFVSAPTTGDIISVSYVTTAELLATPTLLRSGLIQFLNFDGITDADGASLNSTIPDDSGNSNTMAKISGHAPTVRKTLLSGHTVLQFAGNHGIIGNRAVADDFTIFQVFKASSYGGQNTYYGSAQDLYTTEVPGQADDFGTSIGTADFVAGQGKLPDVFANITSPSMDLTTWHIAVMERTKGNGTTLPMKIRTFRDTTGTTPLATLTENSGYSQSLNASTTASIGCVPAASEGFYTGYYACLLVYNRVLTDTERTSVVNWLKARYAI